MRERKAGKCRRKGRSSKTAYQRPLIPRRRSPGRANASRPGEIVSLLKTLVKACDRGEKFLSLSRLFLSQFSKSRSILWAILVTLWKERFSYAQ